ncbi:MAG: GNAT family acetyltransferase [Desulfamplus sp.]|nr:GNAT family acetyltransferase [Desulfamplus sp.]
MLCKLKGAIMDCRIAITSDITGILSLQDKNLVTKISEEQKKNGFVTTPFTTDQLETLIKRKGLFVLDNAKEIMGYTVAAGWDYFAGRPMFDYMLEHFGRISYRNMAITKDNSFQYGPICVDVTLRGTSAFSNLFSKMREEMSGLYSVGVTFINKTNARSYKAHTTKVNIETITEFEFNGNSYHGLAFLTKN